MSHTHLRDSAEEETDGFLKGSQATTWIWEPTCGEATEDQSGSSEKA